MRRRPKTDTDHQTIRDGLRALGCDVLDTAGGANGQPDLWVRWGRWPGDFWMPLEVKTESKRGHKDEFTSAQQALRAKGIVFPVVYNLQDACEAVGLPVTAAHLARKARA